MGASRQDVVDVVRAADAYAESVSKGDGEKYMPLFIKALMDGIHSKDPELAQALKKLAGEKEDGLNRTGL